MDGIQTKKRNEIVDHEQWKEEDRWSMKMEMELRRGEGDQVSFPWHNLTEEKEKKKGGVKVTLKWRDFKRTPKLGD